MRLFKLIASTIAGVAGFAWTSIQIFDYYVSKTKSPPVNTATTKDNTTKLPTKVSVNTINNRKKNLNSVDGKSKKGLLKSIQVDSGDLKGECSFIVKNKSKYSTRVVMTLSGKVTGEGEVIQIFLPPRSSHSANHLPEGTYLASYCLGTGWNDDNKSFDRLTDCKNTITTMTSSVEKMIIDGEIAKKKICKGELTLVDAGREVTP